MKVPTWNYVSVHVYGTVTIVEGEELRAALSRLMNNYEQHMPRPVHMEEIPEKELNADLRGIIGFQILIEHMQAAYKLSQNRDEQSFHQVIGQLEHGDEVTRKVAEEMGKVGDKLFGGGAE
jgi:transcriptional regulator